MGLSELVPEACKANSLYLKCTVPQSSCYSKGRQETYWLTPLKSSMFPWPTSEGNTCQHIASGPARWENVDLAIPHLQDWPVSQDMEEFTLSQD